jgi:hypothetical protein
MLRLLPVKRREDGNQYSGHPFSLFFLGIEDVVFMTDDAQMPIVLRGQLALEVHQPAPMPSISLNFRGFSKKRPSNS